MQRAVVSSGSVPPSDPSDGEAYRVTATASDDWLGREDEIAIRLGGAWHFVSPLAGMTLFDRATGAWLHYAAGWESAVEPVLPTGGGVIDQEARQALSDLVEALRKLGLFADSV